MINTFINHKFIPMIKKLFLLLASILVVSCSSSDELVINDIWFGCKAYKKSISAWFFLLPKGEYVDFVEGEGIDIIDGSYGIDKDGNKVGLKYRYSVYYNHEEDKGYADYTGKIPNGEYFVVCSPTIYKGFMGKNIKIEEGSASVIVADFTGIGQYEKGLFDWK